MLLKSLSLTLVLAFSQVANATTCQEILDKLPGKIYGLVDNLTGVSAHALVQFQNERLYISELSSSWKPGMKDAYDYRLFTSTYELMEVRGSCRLVDTMASLSYGRKHPLVTGPITLDDDGEVFDFEFHGRIRVGGLKMAVSKSLTFVSSEI